MESYRSLKNPKLYIAMAIVLVITILLFPQEGQFKYSYQKGRPWVYETLLAPIDFPLLKTEVEMLQEKEEKASLILPYFYFDNSVSNLQISRLRSVASKEEIDGKVFHNIAESLFRIYSAGILSEDLGGAETVIIQKDKRAEEVPATEVFTVVTANAYLRSHVSVGFPDLNADSICNAYNITNYILPNLIYDADKTDLLHKQAVDYISPTKGMIYTGQLIVAEGELVTSEIEQMLDSFKAEYQMTYGYAGSRGGLIVGHSIICFLILAALFAIIYFTNRSVFEKMKTYYFILTLYLIIFVLTVFVKDLYPGYIDLVPYAVFALYLTLFFQRAFVYPLYTIMLLPLLFLMHEGVELFFMNLVGGIIAIVSSRHFNRGWLQFINSIFIFTGMALTFLAFVLSQDGTFSLPEANTFTHLLVNSLLVVAANPLALLFERMFSLVSQSRLIDLSDTNNRLLRELAKKAPGTFQHSLQVSNLASDAAREIGADIMLTTVGALYHDIGKMKNPQCFVENNAPGVNYHKDLSPIESAQQIIRHVDDGIEIARKNKLPEVVTDFIRTHHAKTLTFYFYNTYCNNGGDPENKEPFMYNGTLPTTKEQVIVLMADAVEAASRSLKDYSKESISNLVDSIIGVRLSDSQLVNADISIREIMIVKQMFKARLEQVYHERIAYPKLKKK